MWSGKGRWLQHEWQAVTVSNIWVGVDLKLGTVGVRREHRTREVAEIGLGVVGIIGSGRTARVRFRMVLV